MRPASTRLEINTCRRGDWNGLGHGDWMPSHERLMERQRLILLRIGRKLREPRNLGHYWSLVCKPGGDDGKQCPVMQCGGRRLGVIIKLVCGSATEASRDLPAASPKGFYPCRLLCVSLPGARPRRRHASTKQGIRLYR